MNLLLLLQCCFSTGVAVMLDVAILVLIQQDNGCGDKRCEKYTQTQRVEDILFLILSSHRPAVSKGFCHQLLL